MRCGGGSNNGERERKKSTSKCHRRRRHRRRRRRSHFFCIQKNITKLFDNIPSGYEREECINQISISFFSNPRRQTFLFSNNFIAYLLHHRKQKQTERIQNNTQNDSCVPVYTQYTLTPVERGLCLSVCVRTSIKSKILTFSLSFFCSTLGFN